MAKPFLKWAGGKTQILNRLLAHLPEDFRERTYHEPFLGAGSMFFAIIPQRAYLSDANESLIRCYECVRDNPELITRYLQEHRRNNCEEYYYEIREVFNHTQDFTYAQAARFIYLNKTSFNGIYRVNQRGEFNVPYGHKEQPTIPSRETLIQAATALTAIELRSGTYEQTLEAAQEGDFVYLDPPYPPLNGTSYFTHYTRERFNHNDHERLAEVFHELSDRGCLVMLSNADTIRIRELFRGFYFNALDVIRYISCKTIKHQVCELVITNYEV